MKILPYEKGKYILPHLVICCSFYQKNTFFILICKVSGAGGVFPLVSFYLYYFLDFMYIENNWKINFLKKKVQMLSMKHYALHSSKYTIKHELIWFQLRNSKLKIKNLN